MAVLLTAAHGHGPAPQLRAALRFHGGIKAVKVHMKYISCHGLTTLASASSCEQPYCRTDVYKIQAVMISGAKCAAAKCKAQDLNRFVKDFLYYSQNIQKSTQQKPGALWLPACSCYAYSLRHHLADLLAEHTLGFILYRFSAGFAEMRPHKIGGLVGQKTVQMRSSSLVPLLSNFFRCMATAMTAKIETKSAIGAEKSGP